MEKVRYVQYENWVKEVLFDWVEPKEEILVDKTELHDIEVMELLRTWTIQKVKDQINFILS